MFFGGSAYRSTLQTGRSRKGAWGCKLATVESFAILSLSPFHFVWLIVLGAAVRETLCSRLFGVSSTGLFNKAAGLAELEPAAGAARSSVNALLDKVKEHLKHEL